MTQHTELLARLSEYERGDVADVVWKAADAIEALEVERDSLAHHLNRQKQWKDAMRDKMKELEREVEHWKSKYAVSIELRNGQASNVAQALAERNALQAQLAAAQGQDLIEVMCARIKAADDAMADNDYMLDSDDCISVIRGTWKPPMLNDKPAAPVPQQVAEPAPSKGCYGGRNEED